eukprot:4689416-Prymnesium_polylepis.1
MADAHTQNSKPCVCKRGSERERESRSRRVRAPMRAQRGRRHGRRPPEIARGTALVMCRIVPHICDGKDMMWDSVRKLRALPAPTEHSVDPEPFRLSTVEFEQKLNKVRTQLYCTLLYGLRTIQ